MESAKRRFWKRTALSDNCWEWIGNISCKGYGQIAVKGRTVGAHRFSWIIHNNAIPEGLQVLHKCDNRRCVNPNHLFLGTPQDNIDDMVNKERHARGSKNGSSKLNENDIVKILMLRRNGLTYGQIAEHFTVSDRQIEKICRRERWKHITENKKAVV